MSLVFWSTSREHFKINYNYIDSVGSMVKKYEIGNPPLTLINLVRNEVVSLEYWSTVV